MIDRSTLPYEENVREVKEVVKIAHAVGVSVEAELGHVGFGFEYEETRDSGLTKKEEALSYIAETGIDCLMGYTKEHLIWSLTCLRIYIEVLKFRWFCTVDQAPVMTI